MSSTRLMMETIHEGERIKFSLRHSINNNNGHCVMKSHLPNYSSMLLSNQSSCCALDYLQLEYPAAAEYPTVPTIHSIRRSVTQNYELMFVMPFLMRPRTQYVIQF